MSTSRGRGLKRRADVPEAVARLGARVSKADLLEVAYWLAAAAGESCDDENEAFGTLGVLRSTRTARGALVLAYIAPSTCTASTAERDRSV